MVGVSVVYLAVLTVLKECTRFVGSVMWYSVYPPPTPPRGCSVNPPLIPSSSCCCEYLYDWTRASAPALRPSTTTRRLSRKRRNSPTAPERLRLPFESAQRLGETAENRKPQAAGCGSSITETACALFLLFSNL